MSFHKDMLYSLGNHKDKIKLKPLGPVNFKKITKQKRIRLFSPQADLKVI